MPHITARVKARETPSHLRGALTQAVLAERAGVSPNTLTNVERGAQPASVEVLARLAQAAHVSLARYAAAHRRARLAYLMREIAELKAQLKR